MKYCGSKNIGGAAEELELTRYQLSTGYVTARS